MQKYLVTMILIFSSSMALAKFLPDSAVQGIQSSSRVGAISEAEFTKIISDIQKIYAPIVSAKSGSLSIRGDWKEDKLNAGSNQMFGSWQVKISGGLARRPELTADGFALILCHELGHHLGGFAFTPSPVSFIPVWAANEGQADYFATHACTHKIWENDSVINAGFRLTADVQVKKYCDASWTTNEEQNLCYRVLMAVQSMGQTMAGILNKTVPDFSTPDPKEVTQTDNEHPAIQCRIDTSFQAALCDIPFDQNLIPGKTTTGGTASLEAERESAMHSCTALTNHASGLRPKCWFKARL